MTGPASATGGIPAGPRMSMFDPIYVGIDEFGHPVSIRIIYRNLLWPGVEGADVSGVGDADGQNQQRPAGWCGGALWSVRCRWWSARCRCQSTTSLTAERV